MTEKGYKIVGDNLGEYSILRADDTIVSTEIQDVIFAESVLDELNALHEENQLIKKHIRKLYKFVNIDIDNEIEVYPKALLEGIVNILKIMGDLE